MRRMRFFLMMMICGFSWQCAFERVPRTPIRTVGSDKSEMPSDSNETGVLSPAKTCQLPKGAKLAIACTYECNNHNRSATERVAKELNYEIEFISLNSDGDLKGYNMADAIIIEGGKDIQPFLYDGKYGKDGISPELLATVNPNLSDSEKVESKNKDIFEHTFLSKYFSEDKFKRVPILGICRGLQMLGVASGIPLYVDLKTQVDVGPFDGVIDEIDIIEANSNIFGIVEEINFEALKHHHQGIHYDYYLKNKKEYPHIKVTATSHENRIVEVMEFTNRPVLGVQFHPERSNLDIKRKFFKWLLVAACDGKNKTI